MDRGWSGVAGAQQRVWPSGWVGRWAGRRSGRSAQTGKRGTLRGRAVIGLAEPGLLVTGLEVELELRRQACRPSFIEAGLLADPTIKAAVAAINQRIQTLAPVLNAPSLASAVKVTSSDAAVPVDVMAKRQGGALHVFAVATRPGGTTATFTLAGVQTGSVEVLDEGRSLKVSGGAFSDTFAASYAVHLYRRARCCRRCPAADPRAPEDGRGQ